eukprot:scaffold2184_cov266-Chaetoceros_neogracile.AAC.3
MPTKKLRTKPSSLYTYEHQRQVPMVALTLIELMLQIHYMHALGDLTKPKLLDHQAAVPIIALARE